MHRISVERIGAGRENKGGSRATRIFWLLIKLVRPPVPPITLSAFFGSLLLFVAVDAARPTAMISMEAWCYGCQGVASEVRNMKSVHSRVWP